MSITVTVTDMSCDGCEDIVEGAVADVAGVESVEADRETETVAVEGDASEEAVVEAIDFAGYNPSIEEADEDDGAEAEGDESDEETEESNDEDESEGEDEE
jgi:copper chaperone CopZ